MSKNNLITLLKTMAIRFEDHSWTNTRGTNIQSALIFKPEDKEKIFSLIIAKTTDDIVFNLNKNFDVLIDESGNKSRYFFYGSENFQKISLSRKKTYKSYIADLDSPVRERINYLKSELRKAREGKALGRPPLLIEELLKQAEQKTLREYIEDKINKSKDEKYEKFHRALLASQKCLISNFLSCPEYMWSNLIRNGRNAEYKRLPIGVNLFFSFETNAKHNGKIYRLINSAIQNDLAFDDFYLLGE